MLNSSEQGGWEIQRQSLAQVGTIEKSIDLANTTSTRDGVGTGFGIGILLLLGIIAYSFVQLVKNLNPADIATKVAVHISETKGDLQRIDRGQIDNNRKLDLLLSIAEKTEVILLEARTAGLDMSGQLYDIRSKINSRIDQEIRK